MVAWLGTVKKAIGAFLVSVLAWGTVVVDSAPTQITATEWLALAGCFVTTLTVYFLDNNKPARRA